MPQLLIGLQQDNVDFYCWIYEGAKHGGSRLFQPLPGSVHVIFLREDNGLLHAVGDYPAHDLEIPARWLSALISHWNSPENFSADLFERIAAVHLQSEFETVPPADREYFSPGMQALMGLTSPFFVARELDALCHRATSPTGRFCGVLQQCTTVPRQMPGLSPRHGGGYPGATRKLAREAVGILRSVGWGGDFWSARFELAAPRFWV